MQLANTISFRLQHVASILLKESDQVLQEQLGIGMSQFRILKIVQENPHVLQQQIAVALMQTEASISRQVKLLHTKQLLMTQRNAKDRREHITTLTPKGQRVIAAAQEVLELFQTPLLDRTTEKQRAILLDMLAHIERQSMLVR